MEVSIVTEALDWAYSKAIEPSRELANDYMTGGDLKDRIDSLVSNQAMKTGASGFLSGLGGVLTLPVTIPADLAYSMYSDLEMICAIARLCGQDPRKDQVKTVAMMVLVADSVKDVLKEVGVKILTQTMSKMLSKEVLPKVAAKIAASAGSKSISKLIPLLGGVVSGGVNVYTTNKIGDIARDTFMKLR